METVTKIGTAWLKLTAIDSSEWLVITFVMTPLQISFTAAKRSKGARLNLRIASKHSRGPHQNLHHCSHREVQRWLHCFQLSFLRMLVTYLKQERASNKRYSFRLIVTRDDIKHVQLNVSKKICSILCLLIQRNGQKFHVVVRKLDRWKSNFHQQCRYKYRIVSIKFKLQQQRIISSLLLTPAKSSLFGSNILRYRLVE